MIDLKKPSLEELIHYGIKGMHWGVRKEAPPISSLERQQRKAKIKKAAIILASAAAAAAIVAGTYYVHKHYNVKLSSIPKDKALSRGKNFAEAFSKEPVGIVHASRGRSKGFTFPGRGGLADPLVEYLKAFGEHESAETTTFKRYGDHLEKVASRFMDPEGRRDQSGRPIFHEVMLPKDLAKGVNNENDVVKVAWPLIKDTYAALYG